ncbi:MAG: NUDIX domain-containing protein [Verrucomicrobia bacterium]|nr:NUDIX domain-containing protein [Verrucomicrobiota bacterium]
MTQGPPGGSPPICSSAAHPLIDVAAALVFRGGKLLITQRQAEAHLGGLWEFPGVGALIESLTHHYPEKAVHLKFYRCRWQRHEPQALGCAAFKWVTAGELQDYAFPAADARLLDRLRAAPALWIEDGAADG